MKPRCGSWREMVEDDDEVENEGHRRRQCAGRDRKS